MTNVVARTCSVPFRKMELLNAELRLLKGAIEQLHGRFELLLAEISDLEHGQEPGRRNMPGESQPGFLDQPQPTEISDAQTSSETPAPALLVSTPPVVHESTEEIPDASLSADPPAPIHDTHVVAPATDATTASDPLPADSGSTDPQITTIDPDAPCQLTNTSPTAQARSHPRAPTKIRALPHPISVGLRFSAPRLDAVPTLRVRLTEGEISLHATRPNAYAATVSSRIFPVPSRLASVRRSVRLRFHASYAVQTSQMEAP
jgi:hypothetical protein